MPFTFERFDSRGYVVVRHYGHVRPHEVEEIYEAIYRSNPEGRKLPNLIVDLRDSESYLTQDEIFGSLDTFHYRPPGVSRTAFIADDSFRNEVSFVVLASENRGIPTRAFSDEAEALAWFGLLPD